MDDVLSSLSTEQRETLKKFRSSLADILTPDYTDEVLLKYLRVKNFHLKEAEIHFREFQNSLITYGANNLLETYKLKEVFKYRSDTFLGFAKDGSPVRYVKGTLDNYGFLHSISTYELTRYFVYMFERDLKAMEEENIRTGKKNTQITYIFDLEEISLLQFVNKTVIEMGIDYLRLLQEFYPERWGNVININTPYIFNKIFQIFKPILRNSLFKKIKFVSKENTAEFLKQYIDDDVLPAFLGGKRVDSNGDIYCREFVNQGGIVPEKYYLKNCVHYINEADPGVSLVTIGARSVFNVPLVIREKGTVFRVEMRTDRIIAFSILHREFGADPDNPDLPSSDEPLDPHNENCNVTLVGTRLRVHSHWAPNDGRGFANNPGIYILQFDNTDSWFTSTKLYYRMTLFPPGR